ncbi:MAG: hypothetical protein J7518_22905 [Nocardioidaceae bacterium]|nr:hypothetical protein [Nocardioidaceae bacterium]
MKRLAGLSVVGALVFSALGAAPAHADVPGVPGITVDEPTVGHVTGSVTSDQPFVIVGLQADLSDPHSVDLGTTSNFGPLETWGYGATASVYAAACPTDMYDAETCSLIAQKDFTPKDVRPEISLSDSTVGPEESVSVTSTDPDGGGVLKATWSPAGGTPVVTVLNLNGTTPLEISEDGEADLVVSRCAIAPADQCTAFAPAFGALRVHRNLVPSVGTIDEINAGNTSSSFTVTTEPAGSPTMSWHLERVGGAGQIPGESAVDRLTGTIDGSNIPVDGQYKAVGTVTVNAVGYGTYTDVPFSSDAFTVNRSGSLPGIALNPATTGQITGTVTSPDQPFVRVRLSSNGPTQVVTMTNGTGSFTLDTWGFDPTAPVAVEAIACPANDPLVEADCSATNTSETFKPKDVTPDVSLNHLAIGQGQTVTATSSDPTGGGLLKATWTPEGGGIPVVTELNRNGSKVLNVSEGVGNVVVTRCSSAAPSVCTAFESPISFPLTVDLHGPVITSISRSTTDGRVYPNVTGWSKYPSSITYTVNGGTSDVVAVKISNGTQSTTLPVTANKAVWNGRIASTVVGGTFTVRAVDSLGNPSDVGTTVTVDTRRIVIKTWQKIVTARASMPSRNAFFAGKCSTLRRPARTVWPGSIGYYANTKCRDRRWVTSGVTTAHATFLPQVDKMVDLRVDTYGAAARVRPRSQGLIRYLTTSGFWVNVRPVARTRAWHIGPTRSPGGVVFKDNSFGWSFAASAGNRYDVWKFRIVLRYKGLG